MHKASETSRDAVGRATVPAAGVTNSAALQEILSIGRDTLQQLKALVQLQERQTLLRLDAADRAAARILVPDAWAIAGSSSWTANDLVTMARIGAAQAERQEAAARLYELADSVSGKGGLRTFGHLLTRLSGVVVNGLELVDLDYRARDGRLYKIDRLRV